MSSRKLPDMLEAQKNAHVVRVVVSEAIVGDPGVVSTAYNNFSGAAKYVEELVSQRRGNLGPRYIEFVDAKMKDVRTELDVLKSAAETGKYEHHRVVSAITALEGTLKPIRDDLDTLKQDSS